jgi:hypothetical protein
MDHAHMDHSHMDHSAMGHGSMNADAGMGMGDRCNMNVSKQSMYPNPFGKWSPYFQRPYSRSFPLPQAAGRWQIHNAWRKLKKKDLEGLTRSTGTSRCSSPGTRRTSASSSVPGTSAAPRRSSSRCSPSSPSASDTRPCARGRAGTKPGPTSDRTPPPVSPFPPVPFCTSVYHCIRILPGGQSSITNYMWYSVRSPFYGSGHAFVKLEYIFQVEH